ncbi:hypothetical protein PGRAT_23280 [Paenibacillus graminis]|uniref:ABC-three component systems C-terminal domain-containing protein n=1 Tax=Paenibacillus graminis TaxID=189425 RepID=A0A089M8V9_9BACL|nr:hypothetical protein PGRAT_23280 [Paenibacillus graminis]
MQAETLVEIELPPPPNDYDVLFGVPVPPIDRLKLFSAEQFEDVICEWVNGFLKTEYDLVYRIGAAGDKGRDVIAEIKQDNLVIQWDNYQCKHYDHQLYPSDIWLEMGKLCHYTFINAYSIPRKYTFVSPQGVGAAFAELIGNPEMLKEQLINQWNDKCKNKITKTEVIELSGEFLDYVKNFDFSIVTFCPPQDFLEQYSATPFFKYRFGGGLTKPRPRPEKPEQEIQLNEVKYVKKLFEAYSEQLNQTILDSSTLSTHDISLFSHFNRQREYFYKAESLRRFARDELPHDEPFEKLQDEVYDGIIDIVEAIHPNGYICVLETIKLVNNLQLTSNILIKYLLLGDRGGICHQLANKDRISWVKS